MEDSNLILILVANDRRAEVAFSSKYNISRYMGPLGLSADLEVPFSSRETTPASDTGDEYSSSIFTHRIKLEFSQPPKNPAKGFSFGRNPRLCDVVLDTGHGSKISNAHFYITFDRHRNLILRDESTHGTAVTYSNQTSRETRKSFEWILDLNHESGRLWEVEIFVPNLKGLSLKLVFPDHSTCKEEYSARVDRFLASHLSSLPPLDLIGIDNPTVEASMAVTPRMKPIYLRERKIGSGSFASVYLVIDEIEILKQHPHERVVQVIDSYYENKPYYFIMPFFQNGCIRSYFPDSPIETRTATILLSQLLEAVAHLHAHNIVHRDIKPANVLIENTYPLKVRSVYGARNRHL
ncbi:hypothetical protein EYB25_003232 [Talaromyces marneffei]|nr:hypothetical protein EYB25_003232 [Talaromyces marneffei]